MTVYDLWLPILASGLTTHVLSTIAWVVLPHHKPDWQKLPDEDKLHETITRSVPPGQYIFPFARDGETAKSESFQKKSEQGTGTLVIWNNPPNMAKAILQTLTAFMVIAFVIGYLASLALQPGAEFMKVFQFVTSAGLLAYVSAHFPFVFWFRRKMAMEIVDGVVFAIATGLVFASLWPAA